MNASTLKDMPVVSMADGAKVGNVKQVLFDTGELRAAALLLTGGGGESILPFASIRSIGSDAVTVESVAVTQGAALQSAQQGLRGLNDLTGLPVLNGEGTNLGQVKDVAIDPAGGRITELAVRRGGVLGIGGTNLTVAAPAIRSIGAKVVTVEAAAEGAGAPTPERPPREKGEILADSDPS